MRIGTEAGRRARPKLKVGICGEHGGDPASIEFCHGLGFDYVSCSPYRVPIARLAAAQAALREKMKGKRGRSGGGVGIARAAKAGRLSKGREKRTR